MELRDAAQDRTVVAAYGGPDAKSTAVYFYGIIQNPTSGTAGRPNAGDVAPGAQWYDTSLVKPIWSNGSAWRDAMGNSV